MRRLRKSGGLRDMVRETELSPAHLVYPMFIELGTESRTPIDSMPGIERLSISSAVEEAGEAQALGIPAGLLFGLPPGEGEQGSGALGGEGGVAPAGGGLSGEGPRPPGVSPRGLLGDTS